jgi:osmotically-inducible protein OsmY
MAILKTTLSFLLVFVLLASCLLAGQKNLAVSDDAISDMVRRKLANDPDVKGGRLEVDVKDGVVTLSGTVEQDRFKNKAEKLTRKVRGVKHVVNNLKVARG